jgi:hypothetical protein
VTKTAAQIVWFELSRGGRSTSMGVSEPMPWSRAENESAGARRWPWPVARALGALATLAVGAVHLQQYLKLYSSVPTIGTLFILNFAGATVVGLALLAPLERLPGRFGGAAVALFAAGGIALAASSFVFLFVSERTPLFGFMEPGYDPAAITAARISEVAAVALLGAFLGARFVVRVPMPRW